MRAASSISPHCGTPLKRIDSVLARIPLRATRIRARAPRPPKHCARSSGSRPSCHRAMARRHTGTGPTDRRTSSTRRSRRPTARADVPTRSRQSSLMAAYSAWYFRLRVEEEIARADRFGERFSVLSISCDARSSLHVGTVASKKLRAVDFAGNLGSNVAIVLPRTDRHATESFAARVIAPLEDVSYRIAEYPADATTLDGLLGEAEWRSSRVPDDTAA